MRSNSNRCLSLQDLEMTQSLPKVTSSAKTASKAGEWCSKEVFTSSLRPLFQGLLRATWDLLLHNFWRMIVLRQLLTQLNANFPQPTSKTVFSPETIFLTVDNTLSQLRTSSSFHQETCHLFIKRIGMGRISRESTISFSKTFLIQRKLRSEI